MYRGWPVISESILLVVYLRNTKKNEGMLLTYVYLKFFTR